MSDPFYRSKAWHQLRARVLRQSPTCTATGCGKPASHVDHIVPRRHGGPDAISNLRALCAGCHNRRTALGNDVPRALDVTPTGELLSKRHWWNGSGNAVYRLELGARPTGLRPSKIPLTIVCGPSGAGKSTFVRANAGPYDLVIDLDEIMATISGLPEHRAGDEHLSSALARRNQMLLDLSTRPRAKAAWFIVMAPRASQRAFWVNALRPLRTVVLVPPVDVCMRRLQADENRRDLSRKFIALARSWWKNYTIGWADEVLQNTNENLSELVDRPRHATRPELVSPPSWWSPGV